VHVLCDCGIFQLYPLNEPTKAERTVKLEPTTIDIGIVHEKYGLDLDRIAINTQKEDGLVVMYSADGLVSLKVEDLKSHRNDCENP
jgi:hypothetical protein